jgi:hypothetical protein
MIVETRGMGRGDEGQSGSQAASSFHAAALRFLTLV